MAEKEESLSAQLMPVLLGLIADSILDSIAELGLNGRILVITGIGVIYAVLYVRKSKKSSKYEQKKLKVEKSNPGPSGVISRRVTRVLVSGFVIAAFLVVAASLIMGLTYGAIARLVVWLVVMILFILSGNFFSSSNWALFLRGIAAVSLGGALSIGGVPTYEYITAEPVELTIQNYCSEPIVYDLLDINVSGNTTDTVELRPLTVTFTREKNYVYVYAFGRTVSYDVPEDAFVSFNGQVIDPGDSLTVDLSEQEKHEFSIQCKP